MQNILVTNKTEYTITRIYQSETFMVLLNGKYSKYTGSFVECNEWVDREYKNKNNIQVEIGFSTKIPNGSYYEIDDDIVAEVSLSLSNMLEDLRIRKINPNHIGASFWLNDVKDENNFYKILDKLNKIVKESCKMDEIDFYITYVKEVTKENKLNGKQR